MKYNEGIEGIEYFFIISALAAKKNLEEYFKAKYHLFENENSFPYLLI